MFDEIIWHLKAWWYNYPSCRRWQCGNKNKNYDCCDELTLERFIKCKKKLDSWGKYH